MSPKIQISPLRFEERKKKKKPCMVISKVASCNVDKVGWEMFLKTLTLLAGWEISAQMFLKLHGTVMGSFHQSFPNGPDLSL